MSDSNIPVRHLAFFRAASAEVEGSPEYRALLAGVVVLRLLDKWRSPTHDPERKARDFAPVEQAVAALEESPIRRTLHGLVEAIAAFAGGAEDSRVDWLAAYGKLLHREVRLEQAADVYLTAIEYASTYGPLVPFCYQRAHVCLRKLGQLDRATDVLRDALLIVQEHGDDWWALRLRMSVGSLALHKGELAEATRIYDAAIAAAQASGSNFVLGLARHARGDVAYVQEQFALAGEHYSAAVQLHADPYFKLRAMNDLALVVMEMGHLDVAESVFAAVRRSPFVDTESQNHAALNLLYIAVLARDRTQFETLRRELARQRFTGTQWADYHRMVGQGEVAFNDPSAAQREFAAAVVEARATGAGNKMREAERLLATPAAPANLATVVDSLRAQLGACAEAVATH